jgi:hypothetical protein
VYSLNILCKALFPELVSFYIHLIHSRDRRGSNKVHHSMDLLPQDTSEIVDMNSYEVYENVNQENSRTGVRNKLVHILEFK